MKKEKIILLLIAGLIMSGCSKEKNELKYVEPVYSHSELKERVNNEITDKVIDKIGFFNIESLTLTETNLSKLILKNIEDEDVKFSNFKGKKVVILGLLNTCEFSKKLVTDYITSYQEENPDVIILQMFVKGTKDEIVEFYGEEEFDEQYVFSEENISKLFRNTLTVSGYPSVIFVDENGFVKWHFSGLTDDETIQAHHEIAYSNELKRNNLNLELLKNIQRDYLDVKSDLSNEAINEINLFKVGDSHEFEEMFYGSLGRKVSLNTLEDVKGEEFSLEKHLKNKILVNVFSNYDKDNMKILKEFKDKYPKVTIVNISNKKIEEDYTDYLFDLNSNYDLGIFKELPQLSNSILYFIDSDSKIAGIITENYTLETLEKANDIFFGKTPVYSKIKNNSSTHQ